MKSISKKLTLFVLAFCAMFQPLTVKPAFWDNWSKSGIAAGCCAIAAGASYLGSKKYQTSLHGYAWNRDKKSSFLFSTAGFFGMLTSFFYNLDVENEPTLYSSALEFIGLFFLYKASLVSIASEAVCLSGALACYDGSDENEYSNFLYACKNGHEQVVDYFIKKNGDMCSASDYGVGFVYACCNRHLAIAKKLANKNPIICVHKLSVDVLNSYDKQLDMSQDLFDAIVRYAEYWMSVFLFGPCLEAGYLEAACVLNDAGMLSDLLKNLRGQDIDLKHLLSIACRYDSVDIVRILLDCSPPATKEELKALKLEAKACKAEKVDKVLCDYLYDYMVNIKNLSEISPLSVLLAPAKAKKIIQPTKELKELITDALMFSGQQSSQKIGEAIVYKRGVKGPGTNRIGRDSAQHIMSYIALSDSMQGN